MLFSRDPANANLWYKTRNIKRETSRRLHWCCVDFYARENFHLGWQPVAWSTLGRLTRFYTVMWRSFVSIVVFSAQSCSTAHTVVLFVWHWYPCPCVLGGRASYGAPLVKKNEEKNGNNKMKNNNAASWLAKLSVQVVILLSSHYHHAGCTRCHSSRPAAKHHFSILNELFSSLPVKSLHWLTITEIINLCWESHKLCRDVVTFQSFGSFFFFFFLLDLWPKYI